MSGTRFDLAARAEDQLALKDLATQIIEEHARAQEMARASVRHALRTGELLLEAKRSVGHGSFEIFVRRYCKLAPRTAQAYMRLFREWPKLPAEKAQRVADLSLRDALSAIATETRNIAALPPPAAEQALKEANNDRLRCAVSRQQTATRISARPAEPQAYETVVIGRVAPPLEFTSTKWPAWRLGLRYGFMTAVQSTLQHHPELEVADVLEALNDAYVELQENGLRDLNDLVEALRQALESALMEERDLGAPFEHATPPGDPQQLAAIFQKGRDRKVGPDRLDAGGAA
jgi:hypothetical protein